MPRPALPVCLASGLVLSGLTALAGPEDDEAVTLTLSGPVGLELGDATGSGRDRTEETDATVCSPRAPPARATAPPGRSSPTTGSPARGGTAC